MGDGYENSRKSRGGGGRRDGSGSGSSSFEREDFGSGSGGAPKSDDGADWQYFLNDYFEEKDNLANSE